MDLYIFRHAWAADRDDSQWSDDDQRPLTELSRERFSRFAAKLVDRDVRPKIIATSPLVRCVETAQLLADAIGKAEVVALDELRPGSDAMGLLRWTVKQSDKHKEIAWVGHAPDVNRLTAAMIGDGQGVIHFSKGSVAAIRFDRLPNLGEGELRWLATAKLLGM